MDKKSTLLKARDFAKVEDYKSASALLETLLKAYPESAIVSAALASAYWNLERLEDAIVYYKQAIAVKPTFESASLGLFYCLKQQGQEEAAFAEIKRYLSISYSDEYQNILNVMAAVSFSAVNLYKEQTLLSLPPQDTFLKINTVMHNGIIQSLSYAQDLILTVSEDKTAKLWNIQNGKLLRTLRIPSAKSDKGKLYSGAISPQAEYIAVAGSVGHIWKQIYIFQSNGKLLQRLPHLTNCINQVAFSPDGQFLVACLAKGICVYKVANWQLVFQDRDYQDSSYDAAFSQQNTLAVVSMEGILRLYDNKTQFRNPKILELVAGKQPIHVVWYQDLLAIGYHDYPKVSIIHAPSLKEIFTYQDSKLNNGDLGTLAWTRDGRLYSTGSYEQQGNHPIFIWEKAHCSTVLEGGTDTMVGLEVLPHEQILYASQANELVCVHAKGERQWAQHSPKLDLRGTYKTLKVDYTGMLIQFTDYLSDKTYWFSITNAKLIAGTCPSELFPANTDEFPLQDWQDQSQPHFFGQTIPLKYHEMSRSLAINTNKQYFLLGTNWYLRYFRITHEKIDQVWQYSLPSIAWGVVLTEKLAIAALGDGTVRWYRLADGEELLALFIEKQTEEWVAWTPECYYMASDQGEKLLGWHINQALDQAAAFYSVTEFQHSYHDPKQVKLAIEI